MTTVEARLARAISIAEEAAALAVASFRAGVRIEKKGEIDLVTEVDRAVERRLRERLAEAFPGDRVVGEEEEATGEGDCVWYVDPIDGTTNFAHGHPFFCVSIGRYVGERGDVAVIAAPALGVVWSAGRGLGTRRNGVPCRVSTTAALADALVATGFAYDRWRTVDDNLGEHDTFVKCTRGVRRCGAAALDLAMTADGTYDGYWEQSLKPWDVGAGLLLVEEAGGRVTDYVGAATSPLAGQVVATNGALHAPLLETLRTARAGRGLTAEGLRRDRSVVG